MFTLEMMTYHNSVCLIVACSMRGSRAGSTVSSRSSRAGSRFGSIGGRALKSSMASEPLTGAALAKILPPELLAVQDAFEQQKRNSTGSPGIKA